MWATTTLHLFKCVMSAVTVRTDGVVCQGEWVEVTVSYSQPHCAAVSRDIKIGLVWSRVGHKKSLFLLHTDDKRKNTIVVKKWVFYLLCFFSTKPGLVLHRCSAFTYANPCVTLMFSCSFSVDDVWVSLASYPSSDIKHVLLLLKMEKSRLQSPFI